MGRIATAAVAHCSVAHGLLYSAPAAAACLFVSCPRRRT